MTLSSSSEEILGGEVEDDVPVPAVTKVLVAARYQRVVVKAIFCGLFVLEASAWASMSVVTWSQ